MDIRDKKVMVAGLARSGVSSAQLLCERGAKVSLYDMKTDLPTVRGALAGLPVSWHLGEDPQALALDSDLVVISPGIPVQSPWIEAAQKAGVGVIGELELGYLLSQGTMVAITGTNGKTTTTALTGEIFRNAGRLAYVVGNIGTPITGAAAISKPEDMMIVEVSSFQLETIERFRPVVSAVLNISEDHLNRHGTMDEYIRLKKRIFENQRSGDYVVLNWDDPITRAMAGDALCTPVYFSLTEQPPLGTWVQDGQICFGNMAEGTQRNICFTQDVAIPGSHNLQNALAAAAIAMVLDIPAPVIRQTLRSFAGVEHRIEFVREVGGVRYINDSKGTNTDASIKAVQAMTAPTVLIAGGYDKATDFTPFAQAIVSGTISHVVLIGDTAPQIQMALQKLGYESMHLAHTMEEAVLLSAQLAQEGGNVLLSPACASFGMFEDYEHRGRVFKEIVQGLSK